MSSTTTKVYSSPPMTMARQPSPIFRSSRYASSTGSLWPHFGQFGSLMAAAGDPPLARLEVRSHLLAVRNQVGVPLVLFVDSV